MLWKTKVNCCVNRREVRSALLCEIGCAKRQVEGMISSSMKSFDNHNSTGGQTVPKALINGINLELGKSVFLL